MNELEKIVKDHKESFDRLTPRDGVWETIKMSLDKKEVDSKSVFLNRKSRIILRIAAGIIILLGISSLLTLNASKPTRFDNLVMTSPEGEEILLDPSINKYTLIQFWASGNVLCDEKNCYYYLPAYEKYKDKGFEIYAISLDEDKGQWIRSIEENNLSWIHVSDLKGWESPICVECNVSKVPTTYLLDQRGNVIMEDLDAKILDETLSRLLADN
jgi:thiol-disulfide isomerase/thioredoxin